MSFRVRLGRTKNLYRDANYRNRDLLPVAVLRLSRHAKAIASRPARAISPHPERPGTAVAERSSNAPMSQTVS